MTYRVPERLAHVVVERPGTDAAVVLYLRKVPGGETLMLVDTAALIWEIAADGEVDVPAAVAEAVGRPVDDIRGDVASYLDTLVGQGLLERVA